jgi:hypothetical protein
MSSLSTSSIALGLLCLVQAAMAGDSPYERETLRGLNGISVVVEELSSVSSSAGLSKDQLRTAVELKLRLAGVKVVTDAESISLPGAPHLYVQILSIGHNIIGYTVDVSFMQTVNLCAITESWQRRLRHGALVEFQP